VTGFHQPGSDLDVYVQIKKDPRLMKLGTEPQVNAMLEILRDYGRVTAEYDYEDMFHVADGKILVDVVAFSVDPPNMPALKIWEASS
jgi:hypothetical protein